MSHNRPGTIPRRRRWSWLAPAVAAAAVILFIVATSKGIQQFAPDTGHRGEQGTAPVAPVPVAPAGPVATVDTLLWSSVPHTNRYRVRLFDADGAMIWQTQTRDTAVALPTSVRLNPGIPYYWRAEARVGVERWVESTLREFTLLAYRPRQ